MMRTKEQVTADAQALAAQIGFARFEIEAKKRVIAGLLERLFVVDAEMGQILAVEKAVADAAAAAAAAPTPAPESTTPTPPG